MNGACNKTFKRIIKYKEMITRCIFLLAFVFTITANAQNYFINEDFSGGIPGTWTIDQTGAVDPWDTTSGFEVTGYGTLTMDGTFAFAHDNTSATNVNEVMTTVEFDASAESNLHIEYNYIMANLMAGATGYVEIYDGSSWVELKSYTAIENNVHDSIDISSYIASNNKIRFRLVNNIGSANDFGFAIDNLEVYANTNSKICTPTPENKVQTIQPNPFQSVLYINLSTTQQVNIKLYDALGKLVREETPQQEGSLITLKRNGLLSGVYILEVVERGTGTMLGRAKVIAD